jgi:bla regulator protein BlaR1
MGNKSTQIIIIILATIILMMTYIGFRAYIDYKSIKSIQTVELRSAIAYEDLSSYYTGYDGCFVLYDAEDKSYKVFNKDKSTKRVPPNSSFKMYNSLIGLETGVIKDENTMFKWDGTKYPIESWNKDQTFASAFANSVVWYYKELARRVGEKNMQKYINKLDYGNKDISGGIDKFWLQSSLKISPMEQIELLKAMYNYELPIEKKNIDIVKKVMVLSKDGDAILSGKTGSGMDGDKAVNGWFVGYVEKQGRVWFFASNLEAEQNADGTHAKAAAIKILKDKGIL